MVMRSAVSMLSLTSTGIPCRGTPQPALAPLAIEPIGDGEGVGIGLEHGPQGRPAPVDLVDAAQIGLGEGARRPFAAGQAFLQLRDGRLRQREVVRRRRGPPDAPKREPPPPRHTPIRSPRARRRPPTLEESPAGTDRPRHSRDAAFVRRIGCCRSSVAPAAPSHLAQRRSRPRSMSASISSMSPVGWLHARARSSARNRLSAPGVCPRLEPACSSRARRSARLAHSLNVNPVRSAARRNEIISSSDTMTWRRVLMKDKHTHPSMDART